MTGERKRVKTPKKTLTKGSSDTESDFDDGTVQKLASCAFDDIKSVMTDDENGTNDDDDGDDRECSETEACLEDSGSSLRYAIDKKGETDRAYQSPMTGSPSSSTDDSESDDMDSQPIDVSKSEYGRKDDLSLSSSLQPAVNLDNLYLNTDIYSAPKLNNKNIRELLLKPKNTELLEKSVVTSDFEKKTQILPYQQGLRQIKKQRRLEREKTNGRGWFHMPAPDVTEEMKNDLLVLQMRRALDPKRFYKAPDRKGLPKYFQTGRIIESPADFYHSRISKKQRKQTIVDELLADVELKRYNKRKYKEIMETKMKRNRGAFKHMRRQKKKKK